MINEFKRYRLQHFRFLVGVLELIGGVGLIIGLKYSVIRILASFGLAILMLLGVIVRIRLKDSLGQILPALIFMILNIFIFISCFKSFFL